MIELTNARYQMEFCGGGDSWRIMGDAINHPVFGDSEVQPSTPISCDKENKTFTTASGKVYHVTSFSMKEEDFWKQVEQDIDKGGYEIH